MNVKVQTEVIMRIEQYSIVPPQRGHPRCVKKLLVSLLLDVALGKTFNESVLEFQRQIHKEVTKCLTKHILKRVDHKRFLRKSS